MTSLHYACQRTTDVELVRTVLSHKKNNINARTKDGLTALDLITRRCESTTQTLGLFAIEASQQAEIVLLVKNNGGKSGMVPEQSTNYQNPPPMTNMGYTNTGYSPSQPSSSEGSPYSCHQSNATSPHTPSLGSPCSLSNPSMNSVGSFPQSSPESTPHGSPAFVYQVPHSSNLDSPVPHQLSYEDHIASQILTQFPEIGHILDNQY